MSDLGILKNLDYNQLGDNRDVTNAQAVIKQRYSRTINVQVAADGAANTNLAEEIIAQYPNWPGGGFVSDMRVTPAANVVANASNYAVIKLQSRDDAGGSALTVGLVNTAVTNMTNFIGTVATFTNNQLTLSALSKLTLRHDKTGSGVQLPAYSLLVVVEDT
jgi:hypothetical protein